MGLTCCASSTKPNAKLELSKSVRTVFSFCTILHLFGSFFLFFQYFHCFSLVSLGHLQERQDGFKSCVALFNEGGHGRVNSTWLWPSILPIPQLSNQRHANAHAKYMLMYEEDDICVHTYMYVYSYYVVLSWISIILIYIALIGDWLLQRQAFYWVVFNLVWRWSCSYLLLVTFASQRLKTHRFRRKLLFKLCLGQSHRGSGKGFSLLILVLSSHPCLSLTPREIEISGCCRWTHLSTAWLQSWDHSGLNLSKIIGEGWVFFRTCGFFFWPFSMVGHNLRKRKSAGREEGPKKTTFRAWE